MNFVIRMHYSYYAGYRAYPDREQQLPAGPIWQPAIEDAWMFETAEQARNVISADERLTGAEVIKKD